MTGQYANGKAHGEHIHYSNDGSLFKKEIWIDGSLGQLTSFKEGKLLMVQGYLGENVLHGITSEYDTNGSLLHKQNYLIGKMHGEYIEYYPSGKVKITKSYINGVLHGWWKEFDENGKILLEMEYLNGEIKG